MKKNTNLYVILGFTGILLTIAAFLFPIGTGVNWTVDGKTFAVCGYDYVFGNNAMMKDLATGYHICAFVLLIIAVVFQILGTVFTLPNPTASHKFSSFLHLLAGVSLVFTAIFFFLSSVVGPKPNDTYVASLGYGFIVAGIAAILSACSSFGAFATTYINVDFKKIFANKSNKTVSDEKKKSLKVATKEFVEKHGKKKCIIYGSVIGVVILALALGLGLGLGLANREAPIVDAATWKARADKIEAKHTGTDTDYKVPTKVTITYKEDEKTTYSDGVVDVESANATYMIDTDKYIIYGTSYNSHVINGEDAEKVSYHNPGIDSYTINNEMCFWVEESEKRAYLVATEDSTTRSMYFVLTDEELSDLKANPDEKLRTLCEDCGDAFDKALGGDKSVENYWWADPGASITEASYLFPATDFYDEYYEDFMDDGKAYISGGNFAADYIKTKLELRSSGEGNVSFYFAGVTDQDTSYSSAVRDEVTHINGEYSSKLCYDKYNMTSYQIKRKASVNLTFDLTAELNFDLDYKLDYGTANITKPEVKNLINDLK